MSAKVLVDDTPNARAELRPSRRTCTHPGCTARALYKSDFDEDLCGDHFRALRAESEARVLTPTDPQRVGVEQGQEGEVTSRSTAPTVPSSTQPTSLVTAQGVEDPQRVTAHAGSAPSQAVEGGVALVASHGDATVMPGDQAPQGCEGADISGPPPRALPATSGGKMETCVIEGCTQPGSSRGQCPRHYQAGLRQLARERHVRKLDLDPTSVEDAEIIAATRRWEAERSPPAPTALVASDGPLLTTVREIFAPKVATTEPDVAVAIARDEKEDREQAEWAERLVQVRALASKEPLPAVTLVLTAKELERRHAALVNAKILRGSQMEILGLPSFAQEPVQAAAMAVLDAQLAYWEGIAFLGDPS